MATGLAATRQRSSFGTYYTACLRQFTIIRSGHVTPRQVVIIQQNVLSVESGECSICVREAPERSTGSLASPFSARRAAHAHNSQASRHTGRPTATSTHRYSATIKNVGARLARRGLAASAHAACNFLTVMSCPPLPSKKSQPSRPHAGLKRVATPADVTASGSGIERAHAG